jgi:CubicO group peptidase (beta-lactamase class C family)
VRSDTAEVVEQLAIDSQFAGVVAISRQDEVLFAQAWGLADRAHAIPNTISTRFAIASGGKGWTALTVVSLIADGRLGLSTLARSLLGADLPLIDDRVTIEHLLAHRSGIGDYLDENAGIDPLSYVLSAPVQDLDTTAAFLPILDGRPAAFVPRELFAYCNSGYAVLALLAERVSGTSFHELVARRVCAPAGLADTWFPRTDELPGTAAIGYLGAQGLRSNVFHLPVRGSGDGGIYSTAHDVHRLWLEFFAGHIVPDAWVAEMVRARSVAREQSMRYGLGIWLHASRELVVLEGYDPGVSFRSIHNPASGTSYTVISNWTDGAWPIAGFLDRLAVSA